MADIIESINAIRDAVLAIEKELGISPKKIYANVRARLDILENRINNPSTSSPSVENPFIIGTSGQTISAGTGEPTSSETAGSLYLRSDGDTYEGIYSNRSGNWVNVSNYYETSKLTGESDSGNLIDLRLSNNSRLSFSNGFTYVLNIKTTIVSYSGTIKRAYFENVVLLHQDSGVLTIDADTQPIQITNGTSYNITNSVVSNQLSVIVDADGSDSRRAISVVEIQKISHS